MPHARAVVAVLIAASVPSLRLAGETALRMAPPFLDNMVLQRGVPVPVWGRATPGRRVTVRFAGRDAVATTDQAGKWMVRLDPMKAAATQRDMTVADGQTSITVRGVLVGDVWLCSGQSNMVYPFGASKRPAGLKLDYPMIREYTAPRTVSLEARDRFERPRACVGHNYEEPTVWRVCTSRAAGGFSGVGLFMAMELWRDLHVPIGILNVSYNGSCAHLSLVWGQAFISH